MSAVEEIAAYLTLAKHGGKTFDQAIYDEFIVEDVMSVTDELRRLLDERGVEWWEATPYKTKWNSPVLGGAVAVREWNGEMVLDAGYANVTPEQAVEATLGRGTCEMEYVPDWMGWHCKSCDNLRQGLRDQKPRYCPNCGRKVVDA